MFPSQYISLFDDDKQSIHDKISSGEGNNLCKQIIIAKRYSSIEELKADNGKDIYFDKIYDKTNYSLLEKYETQLLKMSPENFVIFLNGELKKKLYLDDKSAEYLTDTLLKSVSYQANIKLANDVISEQEKAIKELNTSIFSTKQELDVLKSNKEKDTNEKIVSLENANSRLKSENEFLNKQKSEFENTKHQLAHLDTFRKQLIQLQKDVESKDILITELNEKIAELKSPPTRKKKVKQEPSEQITEQPSENSLADSIKDGGSF
jgi:hypothetical protein